MAKESVKILQGKLDVESLISQLNAALAEEWLAYYQYWIGALVVEGAMRPNVQSEFEEHANEERKHAEMIAKRIIELEGVPVLDPQKWSELARCKYDTPQDFDSVCLLNDNVASERCAILRYQEIADFTNGKDFTTCDMAKKILAEEEEHEQDLQDYLTDIARLKKSILGNSFFSIRGTGQLCESFAQLPRPRDYSVFSVNVNIIFKNPKRKSISDLSSHSEKF